MLNIDIDGPPLPSSIRPVIITDSTRHEVQRSGYHGVVEFSYFDPDKVAPRCNFISEIINASLLVSQHSSGGCSL